MRHVVARNQKVGDFFVKALFWENNGQSKKITLMIQKNEELEKHGVVTLFLNGKVKGYEVRNAPLPAPRVSQVDPLYHNLYMVSVIKEFEPDSLVAIRLSDR